MGYNVSDAFVRVDRFKPSGKWYDSLAVDMHSYYDYPDIIIMAVLMAMSDAGHSYEHFLIVCLEPYHKNSHPIVIAPSVRED